MGWQLAIMQISGTKMKDSVTNNIDEEYTRLDEHLHDCTRKAESFKIANGICRETIKEDLREERAEVLAEAAEATKSIRYARQNFANGKETHMTPATICLLSGIYKLFTRVVPEKLLDERQPYEQAGVQKRFSAIDYIHTVSKLIEVSVEYKMAHCLTFIALKKGLS
ncbi:hypothetical protein RB195_021821 [Necator americanus]|uniref:Uncharacterized protein n=1 Tax=Necator americanus TaxID=51031 RepID=A0ABR1ECS8_NECAM